VPVVRTESENEESRGGIVEKVSKQQESNSASIISDEAENNINGQEFNSGGEKGPGGASTGDPSVDSPDEIVELSELAGFKAQSDSDDGVGTADGGENGDVRKENGSAKVVFTAEQFKKFNSSSIGDNERKINFDDFVSKAKLDGKELVKSFYSRNRIREFTKMIRKIDSEEDLTELHSDKRDFVKMLFKKK